MKVFSMMLFALVLAFCLISPAYAATHYHLWVGGEEVTSDRLTGEGWSYDASANKLELNDYVCTGAGFALQRDDVTWACGIAYTGDRTLCIKLTGENRLILQSGADLPDVTCGIMAQHGLQIEGKGRLLTESSPAAYACFGLWSGDDVTIISGDTTALAGDAPQRSIGVCSDRADVWMHGGCLTAKGGAAERESIGLLANRTLAVSGGVLCAEGGSAGAASTGIDAAQGVTIEGGDVKAQGGDAGLSTERSFSRGIWAAVSDIRISGGVVAATAGQSTAQSYGIGSAAEIGITGGMVNAVGGTVLDGGVSAGLLTEDDGITICGGVVTAMGGAVQGVGGASDGVHNGGVLSFDAGVFTASGANAAIAGPVKTSVHGAGWTNEAGTEGLTPIDADDSGQTLSFQKVQFPMSVRLDK